MTHQWADLLWVNRKKKLAKFWYTQTCDEVIIHFKGIDRLKLLQKKNVCYLADLETYEVTCVPPRQITSKGWREIKEQACALHKLLKDR